MQGKRFLFAISCLQQNKIKLVLFWFIYGFVINRQIIISECRMQSADCSNVKNNSITHERVTSDQGQIHVPIYELELYWEFEFYWKTFNSYEWMFSSFGETIHYKCCFDWSLIISRICGLWIDCLASQCVFLNHIFIDMVCVY